MRRVIFTGIFLATVLCLQAVTFEVNGIYYSTLSNGNAMVVPEGSQEGEEGGVVIGLNNGYEGDVVIPQTVEYDGASYTVTAAQDGVFASSNKLTSITLPSTLTVLGDRPFAACNKLLNITVDPSNPVYTTVDGVLFNKAKTTIIACPGGKTGTYTVPSTVTKVDNSAFYGCTKLTAITLPSSVTAIGQDAFRGCTSMKSINIPSGVTRIENETFHNCCALQSISIPSEVTVIGDYAFYYCSSLKSITLPSTLQYIGKYAFSSCTNITSVSVPEGVTEIGDRAFESCSKITRASLPSTVEKIGMAVFRGCVLLPKIDLPDTNNFYMTEDGVLFDKSQKTLLCFPGGKEGDYTIPSSVTTISDYAFFLCKKVTSVKVAASVDYIGISAFNSCNSLNSLTIHSNILTICSGAFTNCSQLTKFTIYAEDLPRVTGEPFSASRYTATALYVPEISLDDYQTANYWKKFSRISPIAERMTSEETLLYKGGTGTLSIGMKNGNYEVGNYEFDLSLPEGISIVKNENDYLYWLTSRHSSNASVNIQETGKGLYHITCTQPEGKLQGKEGGILSIYIEANDEIPDGSATGKARKAFVTSANEEWEELAGCLIPLTIKSGTAGDVNNDGTVSVVDAMMIVSYILDDAPSEFIEQLADLNKDGNVSVVDVMAVVNIILFQ